MEQALGSAPAGDNEATRIRMLGRCAGMLFMAGAVASAPANQLLTNPEPGWYMHLIDLLGFVSGLICLLLPWHRLPARALHAIPVVATGEIVLTVSALGVHGEVYLWYFVLGAVFTGYAFRNRWHVAFHMTVAGIGFLSTAIFSFGWDQDALVRALVAVPTLWVAAGVVTWLREGLEARERIATRLMLTDALTGLGNRRALMAELEHAARPDAAPRTLGILDLDGFKLYNDRFGHPAGDALLERLAGRLIGAVGGRGSAFRLGGDEFCVLIEGIDRELAATCAEALAESGAGYDITASWGAVVLPEEADTTFAALSTADHRMYAIKEQRRGPRESPSVSEHERRGGPRAAV